MEMIVLFNKLLECMVTGLFAAAFLILFDFLFAPRAEIIIKEGDADE